MPNRMLRRTLCVAGLLGTILLAGCDSGVDKTGTATPPQEMDAAKQQQYTDFMKSKGGGPGGPGGPGAPGAPGGPTAQPTQGMPHN
jgi:hypothetical protein